MEIIKTRFWRYHGDISRYLVEILEEFYQKCFCMQTKSCIEGNILQNADFVKNLLYLITIFYTFIFGYITDATLLKFY